MNRLQVWTLALRPKTLIASLCPVLIATTLAGTQGALHAGIALTTLLTALGLQISTNLINDYFDSLKGADTSERKGPLRVTAAGLVTNAGMKRAILISLLFTALAGSVLIWHGGAIIASLVALSLLLAFVYTAGPYPLAYLGLADPFAFLFFGPVATAGAYFLQMQHWSTESALAGLGPGALACALLTINNVRDVEEDAKAGKRTLIVRFGKRFGQFEYLSLHLIAFTSPLLFVAHHPLALLASLALLPAVPVLRALFVVRDPIGFNLLLQKTAQIELIYTLLFCIGYPA